MNWSVITLFAIVQDGDSNGSQPSVVVSSVVGDKQSIHLELVIADKVEDGITYTLEVVAEQTTFRQSDHKVWVRSIEHTPLFCCLQE